MKDANLTHYIFIVGGVISSVGKGIVTASLGVLLKQKKYKVLLKKIDPYLNIDAGTINPTQHGEVFVTQDGKETDLDIGHYQRFLNEPLTKICSITSGNIFSTVLKKERLGDYLGKTIQFIPNVTDEIINQIIKTNNNDTYDFVITEIGGTIGDMELQCFLEAIRQMRLKFKTTVIQIGYVPYLPSSGEFKTKPTQRSVFELSSYGIFCDYLFVRSQNKLNTNLLKKISLMTGLKNNSIINIVDLSEKFLLPLYLATSDFNKDFSNKLNISSKKGDLKLWRQLENKIDNISKIQLNIAIIGKYVKLPDSYLSILESCKLTGYHHKIKINFVLINSSIITEKNIINKLQNIDIIIIPGGFGLGGIQGMLLAIKYARENNIPFLGICLGFQLAIIEYFQNKLNIPVTSHEFLMIKKHKTIINELYLTNPNCKILFNLHPFKKNNKNLGGTMLLGKKRCKIKKNTLAKKIYKSDYIFEIFRHRYYFDKKYYHFLNKKEADFTISNSQTGFVFFEIKKHPCFIATQFHPEFSSTILKPNLLFDYLISTTLNLKLNK